MINNGMDDRSGSIKTKHGFHTTKTRSNIMKKIKSKDTAAEVFFRRLFWKQGYRYKVNDSRLPGKPDIVFPKYKLAIFIDGEFWHGYNWEDKKTKIKSNRDYWLKKIENNMERDKQNNGSLKKMGWNVIRFWEQDIIKNTDKCFALVINYMDRIRQ